MDEIFFDCDSTLSSIEGIDELARLRGVEERIVTLTNAAMDGKNSDEEQLLSQKYTAIPHYNSS